MNILKIKSGKIEVRKDNGSFIRTIGNGDSIEKSNPFLSGSITWI